MKAYLFIDGWINGDFLGCYKFLNAKVSSEFFNLQITDFFFSFSFSYCIMRSMFKIG